MAAVITLWLCPHMLSQSNIDGRSGINACTLIALIAGRSVMQCPNLYTPSNVSLSVDIIQMLQQSIREGNRIHDNHFGGDGTNLSVEEGRQLLPYIDIHSLSQELPANPVTSPNVSQEAILEYHPWKLSGKSVCICKRWKFRPTIFQWNLHNIT